MNRQDAKAAKGERQMDERAENGVALAYAYRLSERVQSTAKPTCPS